MEDTVNDLRGTNWAAGVEGVISVSEIGYRQSRNSKAQNTNTWGEELLLYIL